MGAILRKMNMMRISMQCSIWTFGLCLSMSALAAPQKIALSESARTYQQQGDRYFRQEAFPKAIGAYNKALALQPNAAQLYIRRGEAYLNLEAYRYAIRDFDQAIAHNPKAAIAYSDRGEAYLNLGHYLDAFSDFNQALNLAPETNWEQAFEHLMQDKVDQQEASLKKAITLVAKNPTPTALAEQLIKQNLIETHKKRCKISLKNLISLSKWSGVFMTAKMLQTVASGRQCRIAIK